MLKKKRKLILLVLTVILTFIIGVWLELDYRILTRRTVKYFANYEIGFYGKDFRILETDIAFILTLIPIGFYFTTLKVHSLKRKIILNIVYLIFIPLFYCLYCFLESVYFYAIITQPREVDGIIKFHLNNVNYRTILFLTILSNFVIGIIIKKILNGKKPAGNNVYN